MLAARHGLAAVLFVGVALVACNGGDDEQAEPREDHSVSLQQVRALAASKQFGKQPREQVFRQLGATPVSSRRALSRRDKKHPNRKRVRFRCYRFTIEGGQRSNFAELCFKNDKTLSSVLANTPTGVGEAPIPPGGAGL